MFTKHKQELKNFSKFSLLDMHPIGAVVGALVVVVQQVMGTLGWTTGLGNFGTALFALITILLFMTVFKENVKPNTMKKFVFFQTELIALAVILNFLLPGRLVFLQTFLTVYFTYNLLAFTVGSLEIE